jgi:hypothetical protein
VWERKGSDVPCEHVEVVEHPEDEEPRTAEAPPEREAEREAQEGVAELEAG